MDKPLISYWTYIIFMVVTTLAMVILVGYTILNIESLKTNPFAYGFKKLGGNVECTCLQNRGMNNLERPVIIFFINDSGVYQHDSNSDNRKQLPLSLKVNISP